MPYAYSFDEERFHGCADTVEEALRDASSDARTHEILEGDSVWIGDVVEAPWRTWCCPDVEALLERISERAADHVEDFADGWPDLRSEDQARLSLVLGAIIASTLERAGQVPTFYTIGATQCFTMTETGLVPVDGREETMDESKQGQAPAEGPQAPSRGFPPQAGALQETTLEHGPDPERPGVLSQFDAACLELREVLLAQLDMGLVQGTFRLALYFDGSTSDVPPPAATAGEEGA